MGQMPYDLAGGKRPKLHRVCAQWVTVKKYFRTAWANLIYLTGGKLRGIDFPISTPY